jgi:hypothetical protein
MNLVKISGRRWISRHCTMAMQKKEKIREGAIGAVGAAWGGAIGPGAAPVTLGLFLLPGGRPGRCLAGAADDDPTAAGVVLLLFLLPRGWPRPRGATGEPKFSREPSTSAMWAREEPRKTLDGKRRWCSGGGIWLRFFPLPEGALLISTYYWAPVLKQSP